MEQTFIAAYEQYADAIFRHCFFRLSDREQAVDLMQETFTRAWEYLVRGNKADNLRALLYRTAGNLIIDAYRKKGRNNLSLNELREKGFEPADGRKNETQDIVDANLLLRELDYLADDDREVIVMRYIDELSPPEIAALLGINENAVSVRLHRAKERLKKHLGNKYDF